MAGVDKRSSEQKSERRDQHSTEGHTYNTLTSFMYVHVRTRDYGSVTTVPRYANNTCKYLQTLVMEKWVEVKTTAMIYDYDTITCTYIHCTCNTMCFRSP